MSPPPRYYFEDLVPGLVLDLGERTLTVEQIVSFAREYDPQPFHLDEAAAGRSPFGGIVASGWQTCALGMRMLCDGFLVHAASLGSPGVDQVRWLRPVRPGEPLRMKVTILEVRASRSRSDRGFVRTRWEMSDREGAMMMTVEAVGIYGRRPAPAGSSPPEGNR